MGHDSATAAAPVTFQRSPDSYKHWKLHVDGGVATLTLNVDKDAPLRDGYELKLNSYDLGVDIELADAVRRLRFEHPQVRCVLVTSAVPKMFCAGANIRMLAQSSHTFKVNFCKFTNETRCEVEEATAQSNQRYVAALNGTAAGGGYELAEACAEIYLIDDGFSAVSLPEVPLLGVLPGTGGLTRLVDKRKVRRDIADVFCTKAEGFRLRDALRMRLVDGGWPKSKWEAEIARHAAQTVQAGGGVGSEQGIALHPLTRTESTSGPSRTLRYPHVELVIDGSRRVAQVTVHGPSAPPAATAEGLWGQGAGAWALQAFRELDECLLELRFNHNQVGLILLQTQGDAKAVLAHDDALSRLRAEGSWLAREVQLHQGRVLRRLDNMAKSMFARVLPGSCFAGTLAELLWCCDRSYMLDDPSQPSTLALHDVNFGVHATHNGNSRLQIRYFGEAGALARVRGLSGPIAAAQAEQLGLVTRAPDDLDWDDELRIAIEERLSFSPDALTGMEQNLRFVGAETCDTKLFGRLTAWQNWIFQRPNAVGERGALTMYGDPRTPVFDFTRT
ncbi:MAG: benzoyl-CoA-dihydrodiol lyase [Deltaproteobacteria bacterium]|nr:benzoyl-CoA-dihydrodiol lyase [Deltaproteobacteria bacterium]